MKTSNNTNRACNMAIALFACVVFSTAAMAQAQPDANKNNDVKEAYSRLDALMVSTEHAIQYVAPSAANWNNDVKEAFARLDALMASTEQAIQYVAPSAVIDDLRAVWERLDLLADKTEREIRYRAPEVQDNAVEFAENENDKESEKVEFMTYNSNSAE